MTLVNNSTGSSWYSSQKEAAAYEKELQDREKQIFLKQIEDDVKLQQKRDEEDEVFRKANEKQEKFLDQLTSENKQFKEWAAEARRLSQEQEQRRMDERKADDERLDQSRREDERLRREEFIQEKIDQTERDRREEDERFEQEAERLKQLAREEDEQLAQERAEQEEWRQSEAKAIAERLEEEERELREREELEQKYDDDKGRHNQYDTRAEQHKLEAQIGKERLGREQRLEQESQARAAADDCKASINKSAPHSDRGALRFERRPFRQRVHEDRGRQLQWHIRAQNAEARMRLSQQLESETQADKREALRQQLETLNEGEREQLQTEMEPVDLDEIAAEYVSPDEPRQNGFLQQHDSVEPLTDPLHLAEHWKSPLAEASTKDGSAASTKDSDTPTESTQQLDRFGQGVMKSEAAGEHLEQPTNFNQVVDRQADQTFRQFGKDDKIDDELSDFLGLDNKREQNRSLQSFNPSRERAEPIKEIKIQFKSEIKRDDNLFGR